MFQTTNQEYTRSTASKVRAHTSLPLGFKKSGWTIWTMVIQLSDIPDTPHPKLTHLSFHTSEPQMLHQVLVPGHGASHSKGQVGSQFRTQLAQVHQSGSMTRLCMLRHSCSCISLHYPCIVHHYGCLSLDVWIFGHFLMQIQFCCGNRLVRIAPR